MIPGIRPKTAAESSLLRHAAVVAGGAALSQGITFIAAPMLTRLYTPADIGLFGTYSALVALGAIAAGLRYELAVALPRREGTAANVLALAGVSVIALSMLLLVIVAAMTIVGQSVHGQPKLANYLWALPLGMACAGLYQVGTYWGVRQKAFKSIASSRIRQSSSSVIVQLILGWAGWGTVGLIAGSILSHLVGMLSLALHSWRGQRESWTRIRWRRMRFLALRYSRFPKFSVFEGLAMVAGIQLPVLVFAASFAATTVGQFVLAVQVVQTPLRLLGGAVGQVFVSQAAQSQLSGQLSKLMTDAFRMLARLGIAPLVMAALIAPELFGFVFGEQWRVAGEYARWLTPVLVMEFLFLPLSAVVAVTERQLGALMTRLLLVGLPVSVMHGLAVVVGDPQTVVVCYSLAGFLTYLAYGTWLMQLSGVAAGTWLKILIQESAIAVPPLLVLTSIKFSMGPSLPAGVLVGLGLSGMAAWSYVFARRMLA